jgi:hypothetical protein
MFREHVNARLVRRVYSFLPGPESLPSFVYSAYQHFFILKLRCLEPTFTRDIFRSCCLITSHLYLCKMAYDSPRGLIAAVVVMQAMVVLMIGSRCVSHKIKRLPFHTSDYLIIVAGILSTALAIEQIYCTYLGVPNRDRTFAISSNRARAHRSSCAA